MNLLFITLCEICTLFFMHLLSLPTPYPLFFLSFSQHLLFPNPFFLLQEISLGPGLPGEKEVKLSMGDIPSCNILSAIML